MTQPIDRVRNGSISVAIFDGKFGKTAVFQKSYKDKNGKWVNSDVNMFLNEIKQAKETIDAIYDKYKAEIEARQMPKKA